MENPVKQGAGFISGGILAVLLSCSSASSAQSLADVARQERERRKDLPHRSGYVYTNEDLKRAQILVPEDRERALAGQITEKTPMVAASTAAPDPISAPPEIPFLPFLADLEPSVISIAVPVVDETTLRPRKKLLARRREMSVPAPVVAQRVPANLPVSNILLAAAEMTNAPAKAVTPNGNPAVQAPSVRVARGDSLWKLAKFYLGSGKRWRELAALNPEVTNPDVIRTGERIRVG